MIQSWLVSYDVWGSSYWMDNVLKRLLAVSRLIWEQWPYTASLKLIPNDHAFCLFKKQAYGKDATKKWPSNKDDCSTGPAEHHIVDTDCSKGCANLSNNGCPLMPPFYLHCCSEMNIKSQHWPGGYCLILNPVNRAKTTTICNYHNTIKLHCKYNLTHETYQSNMDSCIRNDLWCIL